MYQIRQKQSGIRRIAAFVIYILMSLQLCSGKVETDNSYAGLTAEEIVSKLSLEQKASQMVQPAC